MKLGILNYIAKLESLKKNQTWKIVESTGKEKVLKSKWIFSLKRDGNGEIKKYKARLVVKGYLQTLGVDYNETFAPVAKISTIRVILAVANELKLELNQMDVKTAFLNGVLEEDVIMQIPEGIPKKSNTICKLQRSLYGLKQAPKCWNDRLHNFLFSIGFQRSVLHYCLYIHHNKESLFYIVIYVDDIILCSNSLSAIEETKMSLSKEFEMVDEGQLNHFLGMVINRNREKQQMTISQKQYFLNVLKKYKMDECNPVAVPMEPNFYRTEH